MLLGTNLLRYELIRLPFGVRAQWPGRQWRCRCRAARPFRPCAAHWWRPVRGAEVNPNSRPGGQAAWCNIMHLISRTTRQRLTPSASISIGLHWSRVPCGKHSDRTIGCLGALSLCLVLLQFRQTGFSIGVLEHAAPERFYGPCD